VRHPGGTTAQVATLVAACAVLAACQQDGQETDPPNAVDAARLAAVRDDPALAGAQNVRAATTETGSSNTAFLRAQVGLERPPAASPSTAATDAQRLAVTRSLTAAVRAAGWRVTSVTCSSDRPPAYAVQAFRTMPAPSAGGGTYTVGLRIEDQRVTAVIPYHLDHADPFGAPRQKVPAAASCVENPGALPEAGKAVTIGTTGPTIA
jgi:hypothetical protein